MMKQGSVHRKLLKAQFVFIIILIIVLTSLALKGCSNSGGGSGGGGSGGSGGSGGGVGQMAIISGPRLALVTQNEAAIYWDTNAAGVGSVKYGLSGGNAPGFNSISEGSPVTNHRFTLTGLSAGTTYSYQVSTETANSDFNTFTTAPGPDNPSPVFKFITMADSRGGSDTADINGMPHAFHLLIKDALTRKAAFAVHGGDIFYGYAKDLTTQRALYAAFKRATDPLAKSIPFKVTPGGHEMSIPGDFPTGWNYAPLEIFNEPFAQPTVIKGYEGTVFSWDWGSGHFAMVDTNHYEKPDPDGKGHNGKQMLYVSDEQLAWLENDLSRAQARGARHLFVISHTHAFRGVGMGLFYQADGSFASSAEQRDKFWNVLTRFNVNAFICGHSHQFLDSLGVGEVVQWLNGNSGCVYPDPTGKENQYTLWTVNGETVTAELINSLGEIGYTRQFSSRQPTSPHIMRKGPYLLYPNDNSSMIVMWQTNKTPSRATIEFGLTVNCEIGMATVNENGAGANEHQFSYHIKNLDPVHSVPVGSRIYYRVNLDGEVFNGSFLLAPDANSTSLVFYGYGDTILSRANLDKVNARIMDDTKNNFNKDATFLLHAGDLAWNGNEEPYLDSYFGQHYPTTQEMLRQMPVLGCVGNHEGQVPKGAPTQDLGQQFRKYWPHQFVARNYYSFDYGPLHVTAIDQYTDFKPGSAQYLWIEEDIKNSTKPWKLVLFHQPPYPAWKGDASGQNYQLGLNAKDYITPLLEKYGVKIVVNGYERLYARFHVNGITYLTLGDGAAPPVPTTSIIDPLPAHVVKVEAVRHFGRFEINGAAMTVKVIDESGRDLDSFSITK
ncbi:MAG: metallophosphoesterase family protein [Deltaproteobacteria bacterium]|nr:metallophosphoesterase family protein [Deltaproteobacteria bacterium]